MATFKGNALILEFFKGLFGIGGSIATPPVFYVGLRDVSGTEITSASYNRQSLVSGPAAWPLFASTTGCDGDITKGRVGVTAATSFSWAVPTSETWKVRYVSIFNDPAPGATEVEYFRIDIGATTSFTGSIVIPTNNLVLSNEHIL